MFRPFECWTRLVFGSPLHLVIFICIINFPACFRSAPEWVTWVHPEVLHLDWPKLQKLWWDQKSQLSSPSHDSTTDIYDIHTRYLWIRHRFLEKYPVIAYKHCCKSRNWHEQCHQNNKKQLLRCWINSLKWIVSKLGTKSMCVAWLNRSMFCSSKSI